ncbi:MAG: globin domain-containing protein [Candidatus Thiodiazotropha sp.]
MNGSFYTEVFQKSLERVLRKEGFLDDFYGHFIQQSDEIARFFEHRDMDQLKHKLNSTLHTLVEVAEGQPGTELYMEMVGRIHKRLGVEERHLDMWIDALLKTVARYDEAYDEQVALAWTGMIEKIAVRMYPQRSRRSAEAG